MYFTKNRFEVKDAVEMFLQHESPKKYVEYMSFPEKEETTYKVKTKQNKERVCRYSRRFLITTLQVMVRLFQLAKRKSTSAETKLQ